MIATALNITKKGSEKEVVELAKKANVKQYVPKKIEVKLPDEEEKKEEPSVAAPEDDEVIA